MEFETLNATKPSYLSHDFFKHLNFLLTINTNLSILDFHRGPIECNVSLSITQVRLLFTYLYKYKIGS